MALVRIVVFLCVHSAAFTAIVPTTYRPATYASRGSAREFRFIQKDPVTAYMNRVNTTYRLFGKTYFVQPDGKRVLLPDGVESNIEDAKTHDVDATTSQPDAASALPDAKTNPSITTSTEETLTINEVHSQEEDPKSTSDAILPIDAPKPIDELDGVTEAEVPGRWTAPQQVTFDDVVQTSALVVQARGAATAFLDAVVIVYDCVRNHWQSGMVACLTAKTATLLDAAFSEGDDAPQGRVDPRFNLLQDEEEESQARRKGLKKFLHPLGILMRIKFLLVLVGIALLAGKAAVLSFGTFAMTLLMYMKKTPAFAHQDGSHLSLYPTAPYHHQNKRYDDTSAANSLTGGRRLYM